ncbi:MAG TPA: Fur family transcriptional regulator [Anaerolineales bacterium]|nr:Fur family transcriptional regulator [Anaerolineales bacterium]
MPNQEKKPIDEIWLDSLQASGCRLTTPRRVIVNIIGNSKRALEAVEIFDLSRDEHPHLGLVTVYRTLDKLEQLRLVQRVHQPNGCHLYLRAPQGHEHILLCKSCRRTDYFSGDDLSQLIEETSRNSGYEIEEHWLQFMGLCASCRKSTQIGRAGE